ncbi:hypothetical protein [Corynebacterium anserum]|uniref:Uncharacterized protein n=1 Tax=Corynebacterium anserum TaxID=2684406 RepID=A0A7G7YMN4_9CORY|nr:hypothetical protein [Corynebacterium anserum]MBC2681127.1 hypothetical protein [Corynebacterium anserum]QNH95754.1 hypothetical protein GP473_02845 [Corynebacterium anserum]
MFITRTARRTLIIAVFVAIPFATACNSANTAAPKSDTSALPTTASSSQPSSSKAHPNPTLRQTAESTSVSRADDPASTSPTGFTEAPGQATPSKMNKTIASCGDPALHEAGTTFFTDGSSGWTQQCANQMMTDQPVPEHTSGKVLTCAQIGHKTHAGDGLYIPDHDSDGDGVGCESYPD